MIDEIFGSGIEDAVSQATDDINSQRSMSESTVSDYYKNFKQIIGLPHRFNDAADPNARTFVSKMFPAAPQVLIRPGNIEYTDTEVIESAISNLIPDIFKDEDEVVSSRLFRSDENNDYAGRYGVDEESMKRMQEDLANKTSSVNYDNFSNSPIRYFEFKHAFHEYHSYALTLSGHMYSRLRGGSTSWSSLPPQPPSNTYAGFMSFWADGATSVTESVSNEVGDSMISGVIKGVANTVMEVNNVLGVDANTDDDSMIKNTMNKVSGMVSDESAGTIRAGLGDALKGNLPNFPQVWKDNNFGREYTLSFKFYSPYGDPHSIYTNVLLPFSMLLALVLPRQNTFTTYRSPFVFQLDCPGFFACDMGLATSISFVKGGSENLWSLEGLPRQIDVTMNVIDLYPTLMASNNTSALYSNTGLLTFLDNLAGINIIYSGEDADIISRVKSTMSSRMLRGLNTVNNLDISVEQFAVDVGLASFFN